MTKTIKPTTARIERKMEDFTMDSRLSIHPRRRQIGDGFSVAFHVTGRHPPFTPFSEFFHFPQQAKMALLLENVDGMRIKLK